MGKEEVIRIVSRYAAKIKDFFDIKKVILYSSFAKNSTNNYSDIDVAVVVNKINGSLMDSEFMLHKLVRDVDLRIEPVLFEEGNDPTGFLEEIYRTGILVYSNP